jgi:hypothetical protein
MTHGITITCAHCGAATDFDAAVQDMPMDHFRCGSCARVWKRCHGTPELCDAGGFWLPGSVTIKEVKAIKFRCLFCGKEFDTVEACNVCEESH